MCKSHFTLLYTPGTTRTYMAFIKAHKSYYNCSPTDQIITSCSHSCPPPPHPGGQSLCGGLPQRRAEVVLLRAVVYLVGSPKQVDLWEEGGGEGTDKDNK